MNNPPLGRIRIAAPCNAEWKWMYGNDRVRFCGQCSQNVYNLSAMTTEEAEDLIRRTEGTLCVRFYRRRDGSILTRNCTVGMQAIKERLTSTRTHIIAAILGFLSYLGVLSLSSRVVMGSPLSDIRYPMVTTGELSAPDRGPVTQMPTRELLTPGQAVTRQRILKATRAFRQARTDLIGLSR